jgi:putative ABC transport system permease protein
MNATRLLKSSLGVMARYKLRTAFMMLGSLVGVGALTFVITVGGAAERKILDTVHQIFGESSVIVSAGGGFFMGGPRGEAARMTLDDVEALAAQIPAVEVWDPMQVLPNAEVRRGDKSRAVRLLGYSERGERVWDRGVSRGEYFDAAAVAGSSRVALVGETVVRELFAGEDPIGADVLVGSVPFKVVGVLQRWGTDVHGMDRDDEVVVPITTAMRRVMNVDGIRGAKLLLSSPSATDSTVAEVKRILRERHGLAAGQPNDFTIMTSAAVQQMLAKTERVLFLYLPLVAGIALLAGGAVAASLMLASVGERTGEIGLRRAVGARPADIRTQFLLEAAVIMLGGGVVGILVGSAAALYVAARLNAAGSVSAAAILLGIVLSIATGLLAGVLPARRAALLQPADALR